MPSCSCFERDSTGAYTYIYQEIDSSAMPEGSTFVAFDSVRFARATGQAAFIGAAGYGLAEPGSVYIMIDNRDDRWVVDTTISNGKPKAIFHTGGKAIAAAFEGHHGNPSNNGPTIAVTQAIGRIGNYTFISDGPMDDTSDTREEGLLPAPDTDITLSGGTLVIGTAVNYPDL